MHAHDEDGQFVFDEDSMISRQSSPDRGHGRLVLVQHFLMHPVRHPMQEHVPVPLCAETPLVKPKSELASSATFRDLAKRVTSLRFVLSGGAKLPKESMFDDIWSGGHLPAPSYLRDRYHTVGG